jgi:hypothetical protein
MYADHDFVIEMFNTQREIMEILGKRIDNLHVEIQELKKEARIL